MVCCDCKRELTAEETERLGGICYPCFYAEAAYQVEEMERIYQEIAEREKDLPAYEDDDG